MAESNQRIVTLLERLHFFKDLTTSKKNNNFPSVFMRYLKCGEQSDAYTALVYPNGYMRLMRTISSNTIFDVVSGDEIEKLLVKEVGTLPAPSPTPAPLAG